MAARNAGFAEGSLDTEIDRPEDAGNAELVLGKGGETYGVRPDLTWARGPDGAPTVTDVAVREVVSEES